MLTLRPEVQLIGQRRKTALDSASRTLLSIGISAFLTIAATQPATAAGVGVDTSELTEAVTLEGINVHLEALQQIADDNDGVRAASTNGNLASMIYVSNVMALAGYRVNLQVFPFAYFEISSPPVLQQLSPVETTYAVDEENGIDVLTYSGAGETTALAQPIDITVQVEGEEISTTSGCDPEDFATFVPGNIALIQRGGCAFFQKAFIAQRAGASGVIIFNEGTEGRTNTITGTLGRQGIQIPVISANYATGIELASQETVVSLSVDALTEQRITANVLADTPVGSKAHTAIVGGHLDSVREGPGISDNGSATAAMLEIALQMSALGFFQGDSPVVRNRIRFAFWGAEELGLLGSEYYVNTLPANELAQTMAYLNFDMIASPNYVRFVYDGDGSETPDFAGRGPEGSSFIEWLFRDYFESAGLATLPTPFDGRSDYGPFVNVGIPAGGLFAGAEGIKTEEQAAIFGGTAGEPYDPCYHTPCDTIDNISQQGLDEMADAMAYAVNVFAINRLPMPNAQAASLRARSGSGSAMPVTAGGMIMDYDGHHLLRR